MHVGSTLTILDVFGLPATASGKSYRARLDTVPLFRGSRWPLLRSVMILALSMMPVSSLLAVTFPNYPLRQPAAAALASVWRRRSADDGIRGSKLKRGGVVANLDRHELHTLVDHIPDSDVPAARKILRALADPVELAILTAPLDDEPETDKEQASVASSLADASPDIPFEQLRRIRA